MKVFICFLAFFSLTNAKFFGGLGGAFGDNNRNHIHDEHVAVITSHDQFGSDGVHVHGHHHTYNPIPDKVIRVIHEPGNHHGNYQLNSLVPVKVIKVFHTQGDHHTSPAVYHHGFNDHSATISGLSGGHHQLGTSIKHQPAPVYGPPVPYHYEPPTHKHQAPAFVYHIRELSHYENHAHHAPAPIYGPPKISSSVTPVYKSPSYHVPAPVYGPPKISGSVESVYKSPSYHVPAPVYGPPVVNHAPAPVYQSPSRPIYNHVEVPVHHAPTSVYGPPADLSPPTVYNAPVPFRVAGPVQHVPAPVYGPPAASHHAEPIYQPPTPLHVEAPIHHASPPVYFPPSINIDPPPSAPVHQPSRTYLPSA